ncbi:MAG TPA: hypothetical protein VGL65_11060 [Gemmatimonadales bacterium]|jgi:hypothetical protein
MIRTRFMVAGLVAVAAACSSSDMPSTPVSTVDDAVVSSDVAAAAADGVGEDVDVMTGMDGTIGNVSASMNSVAFDNGGPGDHPNGFLPGLLGCLLSDHIFRCPRVEDDGLMVDRTVTFTAADGTVQSAFDSLLTASIHIVVDISGDRTHGPFSATAVRHRDIIITGLAGTETMRTVNGTSADTITRSRVSHSDGTTRSYTFTAGATIADVVLPVRHSDGHNGFPISGTVTRNFTATATAGPDSGKTFTRTVTITFNGTSTVSGTVNGTVFTFDLIGHSCRAGDDDGGRGGDH